MHPLEVSPLSKADFSNSVSMRAKNIANLAVLIVQRLKKYIQNKLYLSWIQDIRLKLQYYWLSLDMFWLLRLNLGFNY